MGAGKMNDAFKQEPILVPPGGGGEIMALLPRGIPHGFTNNGDKPSRLLDTILPGQFDNYFVELAALYTDGEPSDEQVDELSRKYAIKYL
jgi:hypothetical protein